MDINELAKEIRFFNSQKKFTVTSENIHQKLLLVVSEICEAQDQLRDGHKFNEVYYDSIVAQIDEKVISMEEKPEGFPIEIADAMIRLLDICAAFEIDVEEMIRLKMGYNQKRPIMHGRKF